MTPEERLHLDELLEQIWFGRIDPQGDDPDWHRDEALTGSYSEDGKSWLLERAEELECGMQHGEYI